MITLWPVDSLIKVFPDDQPPAARGGAIEILAARGAVESGQCAYLLDQDSPALEIALEPPVSAGGARLEQITCRRVEFVPVRRAALALDPGQRLRPGPCFVPDPLLDDETFELAFRCPDWAGENLPLYPGGTTIPLWITLTVPREAASGRYEGAVVITAGGETARLPLRVEVSPAVVPAEHRLRLTQWFSAGNIAEAGAVEPWSEEHWNLLGLWGRNLAAHRANVILSPLTELLLLSRDAAGKLQVDFTRWDRWVETFTAAGALGWLEGGHLAGRIAGWDEGFGLNDFRVRRADGSEESLQAVPVEDPRAQAFLAELLPALVAHLQAQGCLDRYFQHQADEPVAANAASYRTLADLVRRYAPELKRLDATMGDESLIGTVDIWCPQSQEAEKEREFFAARQAAGEEVWHYTCLAPNGAYPNRFLNQPLIATRLLHWFNYQAGLTGYLHWGFNAWGGWRTPRMPWCDTESTTALGTGQLPAGDTHLVYPGPGGRPVDSIRHEMVREGVQDYELLRLLGQAEPEAAGRLVDAVLPSLVQYERDVARFRAARAELLEAVARAQQAGA
jgi:hypothetical protein